MAQSCLNTCLYEECLKISKSGEVFGNPGTLGLPPTSETAQWLVIFFFFLNLVGFHCFRDHKALPHGAARGADARCGRDLLQYILLGDFPCLRHTGLPAKQRGHFSEAVTRDILT